MKKLILPILVFVLVGLVGFVSAGETEIAQCIQNFQALNMTPDNYSLSQGELSYASGTVLVGFKQGVTETEEILRSYNVSWDSAYTFGSVNSSMHYKLQTSAGKEFEIACQLKDNPSVQYTELDTIFTGSEGGNEIQGCKNYYWFDNDNKDCDRKQFCGAYMYQGLQTFETKGECESTLNDKLLCESYTYSNCPENCEKRCIPSDCDGTYCTADCNGPGSCYSNDLTNDKCTQDSGCKLIYSSCDCESVSITDPRIELDGNGIVCVINNCKKSTTGTCSVEEGCSATIVTAVCENNKCVRSDEIFILSNGRKSEIKIMPETASQRAIERLGELGFNVSLKEVGSGDNAKVVYELKAKKEAKLFGFMKKEANVSVEVDAETGEVLKVKKPWWSFLASGI